MDPQYLGPSISLQENFPVHFSIRRLLKLPLQRRHDLPDRYPRNYSTDPFPFESFIIVHLSVSLLSGVILYKALQFLLGHSLVFERLFRFLFVLLINVILRPHPLNFNPFRSFLGRSVSRSSTVSFNRLRVIYISFHSQILNVHQLPQNSMHGCPTIPPSKSRHLNRMRVLEQKRVRSHRPRRQR